MANKKRFEDQHLSDSTFVFAKDGIHPNQAGLFLIAKHILLYFGEKILSEIAKKQKIMKNSCLTSIGHQRPKMEVGLPFNEAQRNSNKIETQIRILIEKE